MEKIDDLPSDVFDKALDGKNIDAVNEDKINKIRELIDYKILKTLIKYVSRDNSFINFCFYIKKRFKKYKNDIKIYKTYLFLKKNFKQDFSDDEVIELIHCINWKLSKFKPFILITDNENILKWKEEVEVSLEEFLSL